MKYKLARWSLLLSASGLLAQQPAQVAKKPFEAQSSSTVRYYKDGPADAINTTNITYQVVGETLVLRERVESKRVIGDIGIEARTTVDAWPLGVDPKERPRYSISVAGMEPRVVNNELLVISRGLEETDWWSVYNVNAGTRLFDTYVPLALFSIRRDMQVLRYAGLEVPPDDTTDKRLKAPNVVAVLTYASSERVIREALITCDDTKRAALLRSFADSSRTMASSGSSITLSISQNYPSAPNTITMTIPITRDDLDVSRSQTPAGLHITAWKR